MILWLGLIGGALLLSLLLSRGVERLLRALGVERQAPGDAAGGFRDILERAARHAEEQRGKRPPR